MFPKVFGETCVKRSYQGMVRQNLNWVTGGLCGCFFLSKNMGVSKNRGIG